MSFARVGQKKVDKFTEIINYICNKYNSGDMTEMKLWKLLFFCEADYYEKYGELLTGLKYIKNTYGPTPEYPAAKIVLDKLKADGCITTTKKKENNKIVYIESLYEPQLKHLTARELENVLETCERYYRLSAGELSTLSHNDPIYLAAETEKDSLDFSFSRYRDNEELSPVSVIKNRIKESFSADASSKLLSLFS